MLLGCHSCCVYERVRVCVCVSVCLCEKQMSECVSGYEWVCVCAFMYVHPSWVSLAKTNGRCRRCVNKANTKFRRTGGGKKANIIGLTGLQKRQID